MADRNTNCEHKNLIIFELPCTWLNNLTFLSPGNFYIKSLYSVIVKSLQDFRPLRYSSRDGHAEGERVNRGRDTLSFCPTLQVLHMSTLRDAADVNPVIKFLPHTFATSGGR
jgi:hypothetical protein